VQREQEWLSVAVAVVVAGFIAEELAAVEVQAL
jgi:hypothetical protein